jgi:ACR3 family arsenite efflux pump ArsB
MFYGDFEFAIAVAVGTFSVKSREALAATIGPLIEVPMMLTLIYVSKHAQSRWYSSEDEEDLESQRIIKIVVSVLP